MSANWTAMSTAIALAALWYIWHYGLKEFFVDMTRQEFFEIRDLIVLAGIDDAGRQEIITTGNLPQLMGDDE